MDAIIEGSVQRAGDKVRITVQLIDARADKHLWAKSFERRSQDVLALQAEMASAIAREINVQLSPSERVRLASAPTVNPESHDAYLKGRFFFNRPSDPNLLKAIAQFDEAVRLSPTFAPAYSGLSDAWLWIGYNEGMVSAIEARAKARSAAEKAVALDPESAEAHTSLATFKLFYDYDWVGCAIEFRKAIALNPNYAFAHDQFGIALAFTGQYDEAIAEGKRAAELDPLSPQILVDAVMVHMFRKEFASARDLARRANELDPSFSFPVMMGGWISIAEGKPRDAIAPLRKATMMEAPPFITAYLGYAYGASGDRARALATLEQLTRISPKGVPAPFNVALVHLGLGDHPKALDQLEAALTANSQSLVWLGRDPMFDPLRTEPRFKALLTKLHFGS